jgi:SARP family transcriptional regulator, regulator of embCAB operon
VRGSRRTHIQLCGKLVVEIEGRRCEGELPGRQGRTLLAYLVVNRLRSVSRDELIEAVWPDTPPAAPDVGLSALLSKLRRLIGPHLLSGVETIRLELPSDSFLDVEAAVTAVHVSESALLRRDADAAYGPSQVALHIAERGFLPGHDAPWIEDERRNLEEILLRALECTAEWGLLARATGLASAERAARRLVRLSPFRESGHLALMRALEARGNPAEALQVYDELRCRLRDELGAVPGPALQQLHEQLLRHAAPA